jgi:putative transposase
MHNTNNVFYVCQYHVVFCPKYRRKVLTQPVDERLKIIVAEQMERWGQELLEIVVMPDHVHLLVGCDPQFGIHRLVKLLKAIARMRCAQSFPA